MFGCLLLPSARPSACDILVCLVGAPVAPGPCNAKVLSRPGCIHTRFSSVLVEPGWAGASVHARHPSRRLNHSDSMHILQTKQQPYSTRPAQNKKPNMSSSHATSLAARGLASSSDPGCTQKVTKRARTTPDFVALDNAGLHRPIRTQKWNVLNPHTSTRTMRPQLEHRGDHMQQNVNNQTQFYQISTKHLYTAYIHDGLGYAAKDLMQAKANATN